MGHFTDRRAWVSGEPSPEYHAKAQRFSYETMIHPYTVAEVDLETAEIRILKEKTPPPGDDPSKYRVERTFATASDGTKIPIWLLLAADHPRDGSGGILDGYGAYGIASDPWFDSNVQPRRPRRLDFAIAQIRGGGEFGRPWYEAGKLGKKGRPSPTTLPAPSISSPRVTPRKKRSAAA